MQMWCDEVVFWTEAHTMDFIFAEKSCCWSSSLVTVENCLALYAQGRTFSKNGNMKEGDRNHANKKFMNGVMIQKIIGNSPFLCDAYLLLFSLQDCVLPTEQFKFSFE